jgi:nucleotide-binding universal stress UspA family protein
MKRILVPTDFSPVADNAIRHAIGIAAAFGSELFLYHTYTFDRFNYNLDFPEDQQPLTKELERKMDLTMRKFQEEITQKGLSVKTVVERGDILSLFKRKVQAHGIDLIVMGSKGATGLKRVIFGSVAALAMETAKVPVLVVPPEHAYGPLHHIILAMDDNGADDSVLTPLQKLAARFSAKVIVLNVSTGSGSNTLDKTALSLEGVETAYREVPLAKSVNESINAYIESEGCDLLSMVRREKGFFESIFKKSVTKEQVLNSRVPLLVLPE